MGIFLWNLVLVIFSDRKGEASPKGCSGSLFPRIVWTYWDNEKTIPEDIAEMANVTKKSLSNFTQTRVNETTLGDFLDISSFPMFFYKLKNPQQKSEFIRICLLEKFGGVYIDLSLMVTSGREMELVFSVAENSGNEVFRMASNFMGAIPHSKYFMELKKTLEEALSLDFYLFCESDFMCARNAEGKFRKCEYGLVECVDRFFSLFDDYHKELVETVLVLPCLQYRLVLQCRSNGSCVRDKLQHHILSYPFVKLDRGMRLSVGAGKKLNLSEAIDEERMKGKKEGWVEGLMEGWLEGWRERRLVERRERVFVEDPIKLYWYKERLGVHGNFGDELAAKIIPKLFGKSVVWSSPEDCDLISCGSILQLFTEKREKKTVVWTSGFIEEGNSKIGKGVDVVAVRGKLTKARIENMNDENVILGDLGLLASYLLKEKSVKKKYKIGVIPHYVDLNNSLFNKEMFNNKEVKIISPFDECEDVIEQISQCDVILSSSLHGLIVSDSLDVPNCYLEIAKKEGDPKVRGGMYKFHDYYTVFSKNRLKIVKSSVFDEKLSVANLRSLILNEYVSASDEVNVLKRKLILSFKNVEKFLSMVKTDPKIYSDGEHGNDEEQGWHSEHGKHRNHGEHGKHNRHDKHRKHSI